ncbi:Uncharacterised protein [Mycobacteroides abscessus subsp. massiliense]|uniref:AAA family ATPase n=1 Tax=Mycobacteroides abscessus TaxID=36809 RepID=UPI0009A8204F|nr:AAA family ATPase [Mycobacteroides abscessus]SKY52310.1 Uncharacterised protein [Mycobacteroides abscessus subsp. massiliense]SKZ09372.1 Uncharacterised protein [Mycobacteroides abscessus subsp. massiliense]
MTTTENRPGDDNITEPDRNAHIARGATDNDTPAGPRQRPSSNESNDVEHKLLALMTTPEGMATVTESVLGAEVFEDPQCNWVFRFMLDYHAKGGTPPTALVIQNEFPAVPLPRAEDVGETAQWLCDWLAKRHRTNKVQDIARQSAKLMADDPDAALRFMEEQAKQAREQAGGVGSKFTDEYLTADQLDNLPPPESLIADVLTRHSYGILRGRDKSFKSFVALDWSLCLATGTPWQGKAVERTRVLYVAGEGAHGIGERKRAWETAHDIKADPDWFVVRRSAVNLYRAGDDYAHLLDYVERGEFGLVVFDTLRRMSGGAEGNGSDMGAVVDRMDEVKRHTANGSVLAVAHTDKGDNDTRGFSGIEDDADVVWSAKRENNTNELTLRCEKFKDGPDGHQFDLRTRTEGDSLVVESAEAQGNLFSDDRQADQIVMATMREVFANDGATVKDIITMTDLSQASVYRSRARLLESGRLWSNKAHRLFLPTAHEVSGA